MSGLRYTPSFTSRQPRLANMAASRNGITFSGHFPGTEIDQSPFRTPRHYISVREPGRLSTSFLSQPRVLPRSPTKMQMRSRVMQGLPASLQRR